MNNPQLINIRKESEDLDNLFNKITGIKPDLDLNIILQENNKECEKILTTKLDDYLALLDDGIKSIIEMHELCNQNFQRTNNGLTFVVLSSKMVSTLIGIRKMIYSGLSDCIKNLNRPFIETIDVFYACLANKELSDSYSRTDEFYDNNEFYWKNFSKDKLTKECNKLFRSISFKEEYITFLNNRRKEQRTFLSESIHSSFISTFANYLMFTLDFEFSSNYFGKITTAYPMILMKLIEDISLINQIFYIVLDKKIVKDFSNIEIKKESALSYHYHLKFMSLYAKNWEILYNYAEEYPKFFEEKLNEMKENNK